MALQLLAAASTGAKVVSGFLGLGSSRRSADAQLQAAETERRVSLANARVFDARAGKIEENAKLIEWQGQYAAQQINRQATINRRLAEVDYQETLRAADVVDLSTQRAVDFSNARAAQYDTEAASIESAAKTGAIRQFRNARTEMGRRRIAGARAGVVESGSALDGLVETATRFQLERLDMLTEAGEAARKTRFAGRVSRYEGEVAAFEGGEASRNLRFSAELGKFNSRVEEYNARQEAAIVLYNSRIEADNMRDEAKDTRTQAELTRRYGSAAYRGAQTQASATRFAGRVGLISALGGAAADQANWQINRR